MGVVLCSAFQRSLNNPNHPNHPVDIFHCIVIPKSDYFISQRLKVFCSFCVVLCLLKVLASVQFNNQFLFDATEIRDVVSNCMLSSEIHA